MAKVDYVKINNTIKYIQNVAYLSELPVANENSADLVSVNNELYVKQVNGATYTYAKVGGSGSYTAFIDITGLDVLPIEYQNEETLKTAILYDTDHLLRLTWIDDMYYYGNTDDFQYRYLSVDTNDFIIMRYALQDIAKAPKIINLNNYVPSTATNGTLDSSVLATLQASDSNYIVFNNEIFKLADKQHNEGYLVYSHNGHDTTGCFFQKCITITISTLGWVLETQENQAKLTAGSGITIKNNVISSTGGGGGGSSKTILTATETTELNTLIDDNILSGGGLNFYTIAKLPQSIAEMQDDYDISVNSISALEGVSLLFTRTAKKGGWVSYVIAGAVQHTFYGIIFAHNNEIYLFIFAGMLFNPYFMLNVDVNVEYPLMRLTQSILFGIMCNDLLCWSPDMNKYIILNCSVAYINATGNGTNVYYDSETSSLKIYSLDIRNDDLVLTETTK